MVKVWGGVLVGVLALAISIMAFAKEPEGEKKPTLTQVTVAVKGFHCQPGVGLTSPADWEPMTTASLPGPNLAAAGRSRPDPGVILGTRNER